MARKNRKLISNKSRKSSKGVRYVPYAKGFKVPSQKQKLQAIGFNNAEIPIEYNPESKDEFFGPIPRPTTIDDWLADWAEEGQTFDEYLKECSWLKPNEKHRNVNHKFVPGEKTLAKRYPEGKIYIVPIGNFDEESNFAFEELLNYVKHYLYLPVTTLPNFQLESSKKNVMFEGSVIKSRHDSKSGHIQLQVPPLLTVLQQKVPEDAFFLLGLTTYDLYCSDPDLFVAGIAWGCNVAVFSVYRYNPKLTFSPEFWYKTSETKKVPKKLKKMLMLQRSCKLVVHEIGHLLGIGHCKFYNCCMNGSGHLEEDFRQPMHLCPVDLHKLQVLTGFDVTERYQKLLEFYKKHGMESEADWVQRRIKFIEDKMQKARPADQVTLNDHSNIEASGKTRSRRYRKSRRYVPFVKGFKIPSKQEQLEAIGFGGNVNDIPLAYNPAPDLKFFTSIQRPTSVDDWLAQYKVSGQTYDDYISGCSWLAGRKHKNVQQKFVPAGTTLSEKFPEGKIYIVQVGNFDEESSLAFEDLLEFTTKYLGLPVETLPCLKVELEGKQLILNGDDSEVSLVLVTRHNTKTGHLQIHVDSLLSELHVRKPLNALGMIGLTNYDLYGADSDLFVAGMASGSRNVAVFSVHRYNPKLTFSTEFWYEISETIQIPENEKERLMLQRSCKLVVHEIGHLLGIGHCKFYNCCMNGSGHLEEDFRQPMHLCPVDLHKLQVLTGFDVTERYQKLLEFYKKHGMEPKADWVQRRIKFIQNSETKIVNLSLKNSAVQ